MQEYIDEKINEIITGEIDVTNIDSSNILIQGNPLSNVMYFSDENNEGNQTQFLYLSNQNPFGEIKFRTFLDYTSNDFTGLSQKGGVQIDYNGKLKVYHNYTLTQPTIAEAWVDVEYEISQLKADGISTEIQLSGLEGVVGVLQTEINEIEGQLINLNSIDTFQQYQLDLLAQSASAEDIIELKDDAETVVDLINSITEFIFREKNYNYAKFKEGSKWGLGTAVVGAIGAIAGYMYNQQMSNLAYSIQPNNFTVSQEERRQLLDLTSNADKDYTSNFGLNISNLSLEQGFINSNITSKQFIPNFWTNNNIGININNPIRNIHIHNPSTN